MLKCEDNKSLVPLTYYAFMDSVIRESGGSVQIHPCDKQNIEQVYWELELAMSNPYFNISLCSCNNYTQKYKKAPCKQNVTMKAKM